MMMLMMTVLKGGSLMTGIVVFWQPMFGGKGDSTCLLFVAYFCCCKYYADYVTVLLLNW